MQMLKGWMLLMLLIVWKLILFVTFLALAWKVLEFILVFGIKFMQSFNSNKQENQ